MDKMWQMTQSLDTEIMNLDKDFEEMVSKAKQPGCYGSTKKNTLLGRRRGTRSVINVALSSNPQMERIMSFVVDWFSLEEMKVLQGVSVLTSVWAREWQYKDILNDIDSLMWEDLPEDWQKNTCQREEKVLPCDVRPWP